MRTELPQFDPRVLGVVPAAEERADAAANRRRVLAAAGMTVATQGVAGLSMRALAEQCGVGVATLYRRFPSKTALVAALVVDAVLALEAELRGRLDAGGRGLGWFLAAVSAMLRAQAHLLAGGAGQPVLAWIEAVLAALLTAEEGTGPEAARRTARVLGQLLQPTYLCRVPPEAAAEELDAVLLALRMRLR